MRGALRGVRSSGAGCRRRCSAPGPCRSRAAAAAVRPAVPSAPARPGPDPRPARLDPARSDGPSRPSVMAGEGRHLQRLPDPARPARRRDRILAAGQPAPRPAPPARGDPARRCSRNLQPGGSGEPSASARLAGHDRASAAGDAPRPPGRLTPFPNPSPSFRSRSPRPPSSARCHRPHADDAQDRSEPSAALYRRRRGGDRGRRCGGLVPAPAAGVRARGRAVVRRPRQPALPSSPLRWRRGTRARRDPGPRRSFDWSPRLRPRRPVPRQPVPTRPAQTRPTTSDRDPASCPDPVRLRSPVPRRPVAAAADRGRADRRGAARPAANRRPIADERSRRADLDAAAASGLIRKPAPQRRVM
jgi:hypothetical protein